MSCSSNGAALTSGESWGLSGRPLVSREMGTQRSAGLVLNACSECWPPVQGLAIGTRLGHSPSEPDGEMPGASATLVSAAVFLLYPEKGGHCGSASR